MQIGPDRRESDGTLLPGVWNVVSANLPWYAACYRYRVEARVYGDRKWYTSRSLYRARYDHAESLFFKQLQRLSCYNAEVRLIDHQEDLELRRAAQLFVISDYEEGTRILPETEFVRDYLPLAPPELKIPFTAYKKYGHR